MVALLLSRGANPNGASPQASPLATAAWEGKVDCCVLLLEAGADPHQLNAEGHTPSQYARRVPDDWPLPRPDGAQDAADAIDAWVEAKALRSDLATHSPHARVKSTSKVL